MGSVYEATHEYLGSVVALKFLNPEFARRGGLVARFIQEARVSASLRSPYVVQVSDVDQTPEGLPYLVMELLVGESLHAVIARAGRLPRAVALDFTVQILNGLEVAHAKGVVHRDLKPDNVIVVSTPQGPLCKLLDFGIAKLRSTEEFQKGLTRPGVLMGTPEYMAPEQAISADTADLRADLYSAGVLLFEMLAGRRPFTGDDPRVMAAEALAGRIPMVTDFDPTVPPGLAAAVRRALSGKPDDRFSSAAEMRQALMPFFTLGLNASGAAGHPSAIMLTPSPMASAVSYERPPPTRPGSDPGVPGGVAPTVPPSEPVMHAGLDIVRTGTVLGGPPQGMTNLGNFGSTGQMAPMGYGMPPQQVHAPQPIVYGAQMPSPPVQRRSRSMLSIFGIIAAVCGGVVAVGVVVVLVWMNQAAGTDDTPPLLSTDASGSSVTAIDTPPGTVPTAPVGATPTQPPATATAVHVSHDGGVADGSAMDAGFPTLPPFPSTFPTGLPSSIPSNLIPGLPPLPSGLPTFPIPGWPPPP